MLNKFIFLCCLLISNFLISLEPVIVLIGPPGCGKGTFSQYLKENYAFDHVSAGDIVREEVDKKSAIGLEIADIVKRGNYIDSKIMHALMAAKICEIQQSGKPFIIDGFIRNEEDITFLCEQLADADLAANTLILYFNAPDETCKQRIMHRIVCPQCKHVYNTLTCPPKSEGFCDICSSELRLRVNDMPGAIEKRIYSYRNHIESKYKLLLSLFPYIYYDTNNSLEKCFSDYSLLVEKVIYRNDNSCAAAVADVYNNKQTLNM